MFLVLEDEESLPDFALFWLIISRIDCLQLTEVEGGGGGGGGGGDGGAARGMEGPPAMGVVWNFAN
jgi:hypothetical protein